MPAGRRVVLHVGDRPGVRQRPPAARAQRVLRAHRAGAHRRDPQLRHVRPGRRAARHVRLREAARRDAADPRAGRAHRHVGSGRPAARRRARRAARRHP